MQNNDVFVNEEGIKIYYNNSILKLNFYEAHINFERSNNREPDREKLSRGGKEEWQELVREIGLPVIEFNEEYMIISWDAVEQWETNSRSDALTERLKYFNKVKLKYLTKPIEIEVTGHEMKEYFLKIIPEKREKGIDSLPKIFIKKRVVPVIAIVVIILIVFLLKSNI